MFSRLKRWRPRFSLRSITFVVALMCAYLAAWKPTVDYALTHGTLMPLMPLIVYEDYRELTFGNYERIPRRNYVWIFGPLIQLPFESPMKQAATPSLFGNDDSRTSRPAKD